MFRYYTAIFRSNGRDALPRVRCPDAVFGRDKRDPPATRGDGALAIVFRRSRRRGAVATALPDAFSFKGQWCKHYACGEAGVMVSYTSICDRLRIRSLSRFSHQRVDCLRLSWSKFANMRGEGAVAVLATDKTQLTKTKRTGIRNDRQGIGAQRVRTSRP